MSYGLKVFLGTILNFVALIGVIVGIGGPVAAILGLIQGVGAECLWGLVGIPMGIFIYKNAIKWKEHVLNDL